MEFSLILVVVIIIIYMFPFPLTICDFHGVSLFNYDNIIVQKQCRSDHMIYGHNILKRNWFLLLTYWN